MLASVGVPIKDGGPVFLYASYGDVRDDREMVAVINAKRKETI